MTLYLDSYDTLVLSHLLSVIVHINLLCYANEQCQQHNTSKSTAQLCCTALQMGRLRHLF